MRDGSVELSPVSKWGLAGALELDIIPSCHLCLDCF